MKRQGNTCLWKRTTGRRGSTLVEFALTLPLFLLLTLGVLEFGRLFYIQLTLQSAVREASRLTITGNVLPDPENPGEFLSRVESIIARIQEVTPGLDVETAQITIIGPGGPGDAGGPGDLVTIQVDYTIDLITPMIAALFENGSHDYTISMISRNEPFPDA